MATRAYRRDSKGRFAGGGGGRVTYGKAGGFKPGNNLGGRPAPKRGKSFAARIRATPGGKTAVRAGAGVLTVAGATALTMGAGAAGSALARRALGGKSSQRPQPGLYRMKTPQNAGGFTSTMKPYSGMSMREGARVMAGNSFAPRGGTGSTTPNFSAGGFNNTKGAPIWGGSVARGAAKSSGVGMAIKGATRLGGGSLGPRRRRR